MTNAVTIWDTNAAAVATRRTIAGWSEPEGDNPAEPIYSDPVPLDRLSEGKWRRPSWAPEQRANPHANGATCFEPGEVILDRKDRPDTMPEGKKLGPPRSVPLVDLEAGTAVWYTLVDETLAARKAEIKAAATVKFRKVIAAGKVINGIKIDLTSEGFERLGQAHAALVAGSGAINALTVRGGRIDLPDAASAAAVISIARDHYLAAAKTERDLYDAADDVADDADPATGNAALDLIDIEAGTVDGAGGWPA